MSLHVVKIHVRCIISATTSKLINKNLKQFIRYINSMDLEKLNLSNKEL